MSDCMCKNVEISLMWGLEFEEVLHDAAVDVGTAVLEEVFVLVGLVDGEEGVAGDWVVVGDVGYCWELVHFIEVRLIGFFEGVVGDDGVIGEGLVLADGIF